MDFQAFPKLPRLNRGMIITEKIDGTNACVVVEKATENLAESPEYCVAVRILNTADDTHYNVYAQSRKRLITPGKSTDNYGFAGWVEQNAEQLVQLGEGRHYGEWWGLGIQRGYGLTERRFSLFNSARWTVPKIDSARPVSVAPECCHVVPVVAAEDFTTDAVGAALDQLRDGGSLAAPGFADPEGVVVYLSSARQSFKATLENDHIPKALVKREQIPGQLTVEEVIASDQFGDPAGVSIPGAA